MRDSSVLLPGEFLLNFSINVNIAQRKKHDCSSHGGRFCGYREESAEGRHRASRCPNDDTCAVRPLLCPALGPLQNQEGCRTASRGPTRLSLHASPTGGPPASPGTALTAVPSWCRRAGMLVSFSLWKS